METRSIKKRRLEATEYARQPDSWSGLAVALLSLCLEFAICDASGITKAAAVCKGWYEQFRGAFIRLSPIHMTSAITNTLHIFMYKSVFSCLCHLDLSDCRGITDTILGSLLYLPNLIHLNVSSSKHLFAVNSRSAMSSITNVGIASLSSLVQLEFLDVQFSLISPGGLSCLSTLSNLIHLNMGRSNGFSVLDMHSLSFMPYIQYLDMSFEIVTPTSADECVIMLCDLDSLTHLDLEFWTMTNTSLRHLSKLNNLQTLCLDRCCNLGDEGMRSISLCTTLIDLSVGACDITNVGFQYLSEMTGLRSLSLVGNSGVQGPDFQTISRLSNLDNLNLSFCHGVMEFDLHALSALTNLVTLSLNGIRSVCDDTLTHLSVLMQLETLDLTEATISDEGVESLTRLHSLTSICLEYTNIGDDGLMSLSSLIGLTHLDLYDCYEISDGSVSDFRDARPFVTIVIEE